MKWTTKGIQVLQGLDIRLVIPVPHDNELGGGVINGRNMEGYSRV